MQVGRSIVIFLYTLTAVVAGKAQSSGAIRPEVEQHVQELINELPSNCFLQQQLANGARGDGVRHPWMNDMRQQGVKRALVWVSIRFNRHGKPKEMRVDRVEYFWRYEESGRVLDPDRLKSIVASRLGQQLSAVALVKAAHGYWVDVPRPKPHPFIGGANIEFFDDEWLPALKVPLYCAGANCLSDRRPKN